MNAILLNWQGVYNIRPHKADLICMVESAVLTSADLVELEKNGVQTQVNIIFAGPLQIRHLNAESRGIDATTDVLSFPMLDFKDGQLTTPLEVYDFETRPNGMRILHIGDIVLCPKRAEEQGKTIGHGFSRELAYLTMHGALHLIGYDHVETADARLMRSMEKRLMQERRSGL